MPASSMDAGFSAPVIHDKRDHLPDLIRHLNGCIFASHYPRSSIHEQCPLTSRFGL